MSIPFSANEKVSDNRSGIYAIVNLKNEKFYIGSAVKLNRRKREHLSLLHNGKHGNRHLQNTYDKWGEEVFIFRVIAYVEDKNLLVDIEDQWIKKYKPSGVLYNIREEANSNLGIKLSEESKKKISKIHKGKIVSDETKKKMSFAKQNMNKETKKKMSLAKQKSVIQLDKNNNFIAKFNSIIEAKTKTGIDNSSISKCCLGKCKSIGGYLWLYEYEYLNGKRPCENNLIHGDSKPIIQFTKHNEFVKKYNNISEASRETGIKNGNIKACCLNKRKSAGGYIWRYESLVFN